MQGYQARHTRVWTPTGLPHPSHAFICRRCDAGTVIHGPPHEAPSAMRACSTDLLFSAAATCSLALLLCTGRSGPSRPTIQGVQGPVGQLQGAPPRGQLERGRTFWQPSLAAVDGGSAAGDTSGRRGRSLLGTYFFQVRWERLQGGPCLPHSLPAACEPVAAAVSGVSPAARQLPMLKAALAQQSATGVRQRCSQEDHCSFPQRDPRSNPPRRARGACPAVHLCRWRDRVRRWPGELGARVGKEGVQRV